MCEMSDVMLCNYRDEADYFERHGAKVSLVGAYSTPSWRYSVNIQ
jgi:hypothetical protein